MSELRVIMQALPDASPGIDAEAVEKILGGDVEEITRKLDDAYRKGQVVRVGSTYYRLNMTAIRDKGREELDRNEFEARRILQEMKLAKEAEGGQDA